MEQPSAAIGPASATVGLLDGLQLCVLPERAGPDHARLLGELSHRGEHARSLTRAWVLLYGYEVTAVLVPRRRKAAVARTSMVYVDSWTSRVWRPRDGAPVPTPATGRQVPSAIMRPPDEFLTQLVTATNHYAAAGTRAEKRGWRRELHALGLSDGDQDTRIRDVARVLLPVRVQLFESRRGRRLVVLDAYNETINAELSRAATLSINSVLGAVEPYISEPSTCVDG